MDPNLQKLFKSNPIFNFLPSQTRFFDAPICNLALDFEIYSILVLCIYTYFVYTCILIPASISNFLISNIENCTWLPIDGAQIRIIMLQNYIQIHLSLYLTNFYLPNYVSFENVGSFVFVCCYILKTKFVKWWNDNAHQLPC